MSVQGVFSDGMRYPNLLAVEAYWTLSAWYRVHR